MMDKDHTFFISLGGFLIKYEQDSILFCFKETVLIDIFYEKVDDGGNIYILKFVNCLKGIFYKNKINILPLLLLP